jgi:predicted metal-dependent hydrolase
MQTYLLDTIPVHIRKHRWARKMKITIAGNGTVTLTIPPYIPYFAGKLFIKEQSVWIKNNLEKLPVPSPTFSHTPAEIKALKKNARQIITTLVEHYTQLYQVRYRRIAIKDQRTLWGSCSRSGNLNFNWRITLAPERILHYVVVHEVCHLRELNHSKRFWDLVAQIIPEYKACRKWLRSEGRNLLHCQTNDIC